MSIETFLSKMFDVGDFSVLTFGLIKWSVKLCVRF